MMTTTAVLRARTSTAAAPEQGAATGAPERRRRTVAFGLLVSAQLVVMLDTSIVNVALPSI